MPIQFARRQTGTCLGHSSLREAKQGPCGGSEVGPGTKQHFPGLGRGLREANHARESGRAG